MTDYTVNNQYGMVDVHIKVHQSGIEGEWCGQGSYHRYVIRCSKNGEIVALTRPGTSSRPTEWDEGNSWDAVTPLRVTQQPLADHKVKIFAATEVGGAKGNSRIFRFDPTFPYEMEMTFTTKEDPPRREVICLRKDFRNPVNSKF
eukprot:Sspe_Gene.73296::Locus_44129_Transcript_1_5_Confidence_0.333_Length_847::g.73296::m.73296